MSSDNARTDSWYISGLFTKEGAIRVMRSSVWPCKEASRDEQTLPLTRLERIEMLLHCSWIDAPHDHESSIVLSIILCYLEILKQDCKRYSKLFELHQIGNQDGGPLILQNSNLPKGIWVLLEDESIYWTIVRLSIVRLSQRLKRQGWQATL